MIFDNVKNKDRYKSVTYIGEALDNAEKYSDPALAIGPYPIRDGLRAVVNRYESAPYARGKFENHREYIDLQYIVSGTERILVVPADKAEHVREYDPAADYEMYDADPAKAVELRLKAGDFAVLFPGEAHCPGVIAAAEGAPERVEKIVFKIKID